MRPAPARRRRRRWLLRKLEVFTAELQHSGLGPALAAQQAARRSSAIAREEGAQLAVTAPVGGVVATSDPENLVNRDVTTGADPADDCRSLAPGGEVICSSF